MRPGDLHNSCSGFSLLEVILGVFILGSVLIPVSLYWNSINQFVNIIDYETKALNLAENTIQRMQNAAREARLINKDGNEDNNISNFRKYLEGEAEEENDLIELECGKVLTREVEVARYSDRNVQQITVNVYGEKDLNIEMETLVYLIEPVSY